MQSVKRKSGLCPMIESSLIEWPQLRIRTVVLDVTRDAVIGDVAVNAFLLGNALCDRLMAYEAFGGRHLLAGSVTFQAVCNALERRMRLCQSPG
jgi:hypothetical protein